MTTAAAVARVALANAALAAKKKGNTMKITKTKLKEIIKEELEKFIGPRLAGSRASLGGKR